MDHQKLLETFHYDQATGEFIYKVATNNRCKPGFFAGSKGSDGYWLISFENKQYRRGRLAFFYMTGFWPDPEIDHEDGDPLNDSWINLREATSSQQKMNRKTHSNNTTGVKGVSFCKRRQKYEAYIYVDKRKVNLGIFDTLEQAAETRRIAAEDIYKQFNK